MRALVILVALVATAYAQPGTTLSYRVKQNDTLDVIAAEYYGDRSQAKLIVAENKLKKKVQQGQRLRIPVTREITTEKGDTFESLAKTHLGDARRAVVLADFNERDVTDVPAVGTPISIPIQITHVAQGNETLSAIAAQFWDSSKEAEMLRRYNFLDKSSLEKGESIIIPMIKLRVRANRLPGPDEEAKARRTEQRAASAEAQRALPLARTAWLQGDFANLLAALEPLAGRVDLLDTASAIEIGMLLGRSYVAYEKPDKAVEAFSRVLDRKPTHAVTAYAESPKVIEAWKKAGGQLQP
jgi:LysM repeat protein